MPDYLKINDVAKLMRTTPDAIRFYEKNNIIKPERCSDNQYRNFSMKDIQRLYDCKMLQNVQFSLSDIANVISTTTVDELDYMMAKKEQEIKKSIEMQMLALDKITRIKQAKETISQYKDIFLIKDRPHVLMYNYAKDNSIDKVSLDHPYYEAVMNYHNLFDCSIVIPFHNIRDTQLENKSEFGFVVDFEIAKKHCIPQEKPVKEIMPCKCVYTVIKAENIIKYNLLNPLFDWLKQHNFDPSGDILCRVLKVTYDQGEPVRFYEVWCPIS